MSSNTQSQRNQTFGAYTASQARAYAVGRGTYNPELYTTILTHHAATGGGFDRLLDIGTGPGNAIRDIAPNFAKATGIDGSVEMINRARAEGGSCKNGEGIGFEVVPAEECDHVTGVEEGSVDLITAAMAAHWFDMNKFWKAASRALKPGGTVALWTVSSLYCHPSTPNAAQVQKILFELERETLAPYELPANRLSRDMYDDLELPWTIPDTVSSFCESDLVRIYWNCHGQCHVNESFFSGAKEQSLAELEAGLATASMVTRWRQANPELVGTEHDCVSRTIAKLREVLDGQERLATGGATVLLMLKKRGQGA